MITYHIPDQKNLEKEIIKSFSQYGFMLRPSTINKCFEFLFSLGTFSTNIRPNLKEVLQIIKELIIFVQQIFLHGNSDKNIVEDSALEEAIKLYRSKSLISIEEELMKVPESLQIEIEQPKKLKPKKVDDKISYMISRKVNNSVVYLNSFEEIPNLMWDKVKQNFIELQKDHSEHGIFGAAEAKTEMYRQRFEIVREKLLRSNQYRFPFQGKSNIEAKDGRILISDVGSLLGSAGEKNILGIIFQSEYSMFYIQDFFHKVKLELDANVISNGFIVEGNVVIATGVYRGDAFKVRQLSQPLIENKTEFENLVENKDWFGVKGKVEKLLGSLLSFDLTNLNLNDSQNTSQAQKKIERFYQSFKNKQKSLGIFDVTINPYYQNLDKNNYKILIFADFMLDNVDVLTNFEKILNEFQNLQPLMFVLMGDFSSKETFNSKPEYEEYEQSIESFIGILEKFPNLMNNCFWVMVPSPTDFSLGILPVKHMIPSIFNKLEKKIPLWINAPNPFRISVFGKQIIFSRKDLTKDLTRSSIARVNDLRNSKLHTINTVISQCHLCPVNMYLQPISCEYDYTLRLLTLPDFLILADGTLDKYVYSPYKSEDEQDDTNMQDTLDDNENNNKICNPGSFSKTGNFLILNLENWKINISKI